MRSNKYCYAGKIVFIYFFLSFWPVSVGDSPTSRGPRLQPLRLSSTSGGVSLPVSSAVGGGRVHVEVTLSGRGEVLEELVETVVAVLAGVQKLVKAEDAVLTSVRIELAISGRGLWERSKALSGGCFCKLYVNFWHLMCFSLSFCDDCGYICPSFADDAQGQAHFCKLLNFFVLTVALTAAMAQAKMIHFMLLFSVLRKVSSLLG